jgi:hypothetical protein
MGPVYFYRLVEFNNRIGITQCGSANGGQ